MQIIILLTNTVIIFAPGSRVTPGAAQSGQCARVRPVPGLPRYIPLLWQHPRQAQTGGSGFTVIAGLSLQTDCHSNVIIQYISCLEIEFLTL